MRKGFLEFLVVYDPAFFQVDQKHLAWLQTPFLDNSFLRNGQASAFRPHDDQLIIGDDISGRSQAIAIQRCADLPSIRERYGCRTIPRLHHGRMVFIERAPVRVHVRMPFPCFRNHHHHGMWH